VNTNKKNKTILICPLNWGLGHATRGIPLISHFVENNYKVIIGADKAPLKLLQKEFPELQFIKIPAPEIKYSAKKSLAWKMFFSSPKLLWGIYKEHQQLKKHIKNHKIDIVISDNRYGLWNKNIHSIFITHQLEIQTPEKLKFFKRILNKINLWFIKQYNECWVPDFDDKQNIAGNLSHPHNLPGNVRYIGLLSRFSQIKIQPVQYDYEILVILSGPEPQRSILQNLLQKQIIESNKKALFVLGKPHKTIRYTQKNIDFVSHLPGNQLAAYIVSTTHVISRAGYSSIMDYLYLKKNAILIPTPGQTEQEYLAALLHRKKWFYSSHQYSFNLKKALNECGKFAIPKNLFAENKNDLFNLLNPK
jgi:uncharacterized protein (TIGR00661 family)